MESKVLFTVSAHLGDSAGHASDTARVERAVQLSRDEEKKAETEGKVAAGGGGGM